MNHPLSTYSNPNHKPIWGYAFLGACIYLIFKKQSDKSIANPKIIKGKKVLQYTSVDEIKKENIGFVSLPDNPVGFMAWESNTYQANIFENPEDVTQENQSVFLPRAMTKGRILPWGMQPPFARFFKSAPKSLISAAQYKISDDGKSAEIIFMSTRPGWKKQGLMSVLIDAIKDQHDLENVTYWEPTKDGEKFVAKRKKKNPSSKKGGVYEK